eukprot:TRINITY_DN430_c0_g1_i3.p1 TRINITY_DN430_c0_g1~~TRINITY_DN430_c0_g1_i3.p1  ORF type:complete len:531 (-),score=261.20 TRINITY_DN430_c0_g1_i3:49-1641(-)
MVALRAVLAPALALAAAVVAGAAAESPAGGEVVDFAALGREAEDGVQLAAVAEQASARDDGDHNEGDHNEGEHNEGEHNEGGDNGGDANQGDQGGDEEEDHNGDEGGESPSTSSTTSSSTTSSTGTPSSASSELKPFEGPKVVVSATCRWCRRIVEASFARDEKQRVPTPCTEHVEDVQPMCAVFMRENTVRLNYALSPTAVCVALEQCTAGEAHADEHLEVAEAAKRNKLEMRLKIESGVYTQDVSDDRFRPLQTGYGDRVYDKRIEFNKPFERPPFVHLALSGFDVDDNADLRLKLEAIEIDRYGYTLQVHTWSTTRVRDVAVDWVAYSRSFAPRTELRGGRLAATDPTVLAHPVHFPKGFASQPSAAVAIMGIDAAQGRNVRLAVGARSVDRDTIVTELRTVGDSVNRWASLSWLVFDPTRLQMTTGVHRVDNTNAAFAQLATGGAGTGGDRIYRSRITYTRTDFEVTPEVVLQLAEFDFEKGLSPRVKVTGENFGKDGFTLIVKTWEDTRINVIGVRYIAFHKTAL